MNEQSENKGDKPVLEAAWRSMLYGRPSIFQISRWIVLDSPTDPFNSKHNKPGHVSFDATPRPPGSLYSQCRDYILLLMFISPFQTCNGYNAKARYSDLSECAQK